MGGTVLLMVRGAALFLLEEGSSLGSRDVEEVYEGSDVEIALPWADVSLGENARQPVLDTWLGRKR